MPKAVSCQHPWLASSPHSHSYCLEGSLLSGTWKARSLAPGLASAPATPLRGSKAIYFLSPLERRTGPPPEPALQVHQQQAALPASGLQGVPAAHPSRAWHSRRAPRSPQPSERGVRATVPQELRLVLATLPSGTMSISAPVPSFPRKPWGSSHA